jgi:hypothetical protein
MRSVACNRHARRYTATVESFEVVSDMFNVVGNCTCELRTDVVRSILQYYIVVVARLITEMHLK